MQLLRSLIFVPGNRPNMLERARSFSADIIMVDLEDSVPPSEKLTARDLAHDWVSTLADEGQKVVVRVNSLDTGLTRDEMASVVGAGLSGISLGKVDSPWDIQEAERMLGPLEARAGLEPGSVGIIPWIENAQAVVNLHQIASSSPRIMALAFGAEDYTNDLGVQRTDQGEEVYFPRAAVAVAARAARVASLDSPFVAFRDPEGLKKDAGRARQLGYTGKFAIHPSQLDIINETFSPLPEDVEYAHQVVEAWNQAEATGRGSLDLNGRMVDVPVVKRAQNLLALAEAISRQSRS